jgi:hypothetical protein
VAVFTESGTLMQTMVGGVLSSPWGIALAPAGFGQFGGDSVGNESHNSEINAFQPGNREVRRHDPDQRWQRQHTGRPLGPRLWYRGQQREPQHPLLHRWHQPKGRRPVWRHLSRAGKHGRRCDNGRQRH